MKQNTFNEIVKTFETTKDRRGEFLNMHYLLIHQDDQTFKHSFNNHRTPSDIRSISKTVLTLIAGIVSDLAGKGKYPEFNEETYIYPIIENKVNLVNLDNLDKLKKIKVKHLVNHTIGYDKVLLMRGDIKDMDPFSYLDYVINEPIKYNPGEHYLYSNAGFYLLSVVLEEFLQENLLTFIDRYLFSKLDITNFEWEKYGDYLAGATRLRLLPEDLIKIGQVIMNDGFYQNQVIVSTDWIEFMRSHSIYTPNRDTPEAVFRRYAYAHGMWLAKKKIFFGHGTDGQTLVMIPEKNAIIITLAHQDDMTELEKLIDTIITEHL